MFNKLWVAILILFLPLNIFSAQFSADIEVTSEGKLYQKGKIYVNNVQRRIEMSDMGNEKSVMIIDIKENKGYILIEDEKSYTELGDISAFLQNENQLKSIKATTLGSEKIDGLSCKILQNDLGSGVKQRYWYAEEVDFPIKIETQLNDKEYSITRYKNIKIGALNKELFKIPRGYKKVTSH
jgi:outer membrane lipoprotein-sorting protein